MKQPVISTGRQLLSQVLKLVLPLLILVAVTVMLLGLVLALNWARQPFPGALFYPKLIASDLHGASWSAIEQGLAVNDVLLRVDGEPVSSGYDLFLLLQQKQAGEKVSLHLAPGPASDIPKPLSITLTPFALEELLMFFWLPYGIGIVYLGLGLIVYRLRGTARVGLVFASFCAIVALIMGGLFDQYTLHFLTPLWTAAFPLAGAALFHLSFIFPVEIRLIRRRPWLPAIPYTVAIILAGINLYAIYSNPDPLAYLYTWRGSSIFISLSVLTFLMLLVNTRLSTLSPVIRQQATIIFWGSAIAFSPIALWVAAMAFNVQGALTLPVFALVITPLVIFPITVGYAALRYHLLNLDTLFSRGTVFISVTLLVTLGYIAVVSFLAITLRDTQLFQNPVMLTLFVAILVILLGPAREWVQALVDKLVRRESFDSRQMLQSFGQTLISSPLDTNRILEIMLKQTSDAMSPERSFVFLRNDILDIFEIRCQHAEQDTQTVEVRFGISDDLARWLADSNDILQLSPDGEPLSQVNISREELARLNMLGIILCVPLPGPECLLGWLALGPKSSGHAYTNNDALFLATLASQTTIALENARFLKQANQRTAELEVMQKISVAIQAEVETDTLLTSVVEHATRLLDAEGGMVFLLERDRETLKVVVSYRLDRDYTGSIVKKGEGIAGQVMLHGQSMIIDSFQSFTERADAFKLARFGAVLAVPLQWSGQVQGVLFLVHRPHGLRFSRDNVSLMELFATQAAIALEKSRLLQETRHRADQLAMLSEVSVAISSTLDLETTFQRIMDRAVQILNTEAGSLLLVDRQRKELTFEVVLGPSGEELQGLKTSLGKGIVGTVAQSGKPLIVNDAPSDPRWNVAFDEAIGFKTKDILCVPMITHDLVVGVIEVINKKDGSIFKQEDCNLLMSFSAQAAIAIENAQLFTRTDKALSERVQELQALQMFDRELQNSLELDKVLDFSLTYAMDALGVSMGLMGIIDNKEEGGLYLFTQRGMPMEMGRYRRDPWPLTKGVLGRVARTGEIAWVNDISQEKDYIPKSHRTRSLLVIPVVREDEVLAVIDLESTDPDYFTSDDVTFVSRLANHAGIAIENAQLFEQVKEANQAKTEFMNIASHELKIPMTSIKGYSKLLQMGAAGELNERQQDFLAVISNNVDRMAGLVNDLLDVSRIEAGRIRLEVRDVQMSDVIHDVLESVENQIKSKKLNLKLQISDDLPQLRADYNRMIQILTNLVSNAYKYTPEGGEICLIAQPYNNGEIDGVSITVKDTGYGIAEEDQAKLFTNFFRSSDQQIRDEPGTGLGLSITKNMIETHGGELSFESEYGRGSAFTFTLPKICKVPPGVEVTER